jgi:signal transduction histidine kinase
MSDLSALSQQDWFRYLLKRQSKKPHHQRSNDQRSWWQSPFIGYPLSLVFVAGAFLIQWLETLWGMHDYFTETPFVIATLLVGWIWGLGPALFTLIVQLFAVDYLLTPPVSVLTFFLWPDIMSYLSFVTIQLVVLCLVIKKKKYQQQLLSTQQELSQHAEDLAESNQALIQSNALLEQADRIKDQFLGLATHELKTPITTIQGHAQLALRRLSQQQPLPANFATLVASLEKMDAQTHSLSALVNDLLNISCLRSGKWPLRTQPCDLCRLCREITKDQSELTGRQIDLKLPSVPLVLQVDEQRFSQVIINLVANALKYSPANTVVQVELSQHPTETILAVHNDGTTIPPAQQDSIFEPFYRTPEARTSSTQGWGLGLAISKEIVKQHGGRIWIESSDEKGTTFLVSLLTPRSDAQSE